MKLRIFLTFLVGCILCSVASGRVWTNIKGQQIDAELIEVHEEHIVMRSADGKVFPYKIEYLRQADQDHLNVLRAQASQSAATASSAMPGGPAPTPSAPVAPASTPTTATSLAADTQAEAGAEAAEEEPAKGAGKSQLFLYLGIGVVVMVVVIALRKVLFNNILTGFIFGCVAAFFCAVVWAKVTIMVGGQVGYMASIVGVVVGIAVRIAGDPNSTMQGFIGAGLALAACIIGNVFCVVALYGVNANLDFFEALRYYDYSQAVQAYKQMFHPIDFVFYSLAIAEGFILSTIGGDEEETLHAQGRRRRQQN